MHIQNNNITPTTSLCYVCDILSLINSTILTADMIPLCTKKPVCKQ